MKIAICGVWHVHAVGYAKDALACAEVIGFYEGDAEKAAAFANATGISQFATLDELLESDAEGVIVCTSSDTHADVMVKIAEAKKDIFTEKVLALTDEDCERVEKAVNENGVRFVISLFQKYDGALMRAKEIVDSGELGKINYVRFRNCHTGSIDNKLPKHFYDAKECGGGAMIDLGAHGMYIIDWILGTPLAAKSVFTLACDRDDVAEKNTDKVEDNAVTVMSYADGAIAINETSFVSRYYPRTLEIGGENGRVEVNGSNIVKVTVATKGKPEIITPLESLPKPIIQFLTGSILPGCGMKEAKALTHMMVMAYGDVAKN